MTAGSGSGRIDAATRLVRELEPIWVAALGRLIAAATPFPPGDGYTMFADVAESLLAPRGFSCRRVEVPEALWQATGSAGPRVNLLARRGIGRPVCSIYVHVDTAPAGDGWTRPPFTLTREGDRLYGRGTADMKGTLAATLAAVDAIDRSGLTPVYDLQLLLCTDEEGGLYPGVRHLAEQGLIEGHVLCFNGGAAPRIWAGCFGSLDLAVTITGRAAHSGEGQGINAVEAALPVLARFQDLKTRVEARVSKLPSPPHWQGRPLHARLNVTAIRGGEKGSAVPGLCTLVVNRRYTPEEAFEEVRREIEAAVSEGARNGPALAVTTEVVGHLVPVVAPDEGPHWPRWQRALSFGFGYAPQDFRRWGASSSSDMGFVQAVGRHEILLGGLSRPEARVHGPDEFTTTGDVTALALSLMHYLTDPEPIPETTSRGALP